MPHTAGWDEEANHGLTHETKVTAPANAAAIDTQRSLGFLAPPAMPPLVNHMAKRRSARRWSGTTAITATLLPPVRRLSFTSHRGAGNLPPQMRCHGEGMGCPINHCLGTSARVGIRFQNLISCVYPININPTYLRLLTDSLDQSQGKGRQRRLGTVPTPMALPVERCGCYGVATPPGRIARIQLRQSVH